MAPPIPSAPVPGPLPSARTSLRLEPVAHVGRPSTRFWVYTVASYLIPTVAALALPRDPGLYDEFVWLITLAPAFLLSLHFGLRGALVGLLAGTSIFLGVQLVLALTSQAYDFRVTVPIYVAYSALAISVGWLSQELHDRYQGEMERARLAAVGQVAVTIRHEVNNALATIMAEGQMLAEVEGGLTAEQRQAARAIYEASKRISADLRKLTNLETAPITDDLRGVEMLDLQKARERPGAF